MCSHFKTITIAVLLVWTAAFSSIMAQTGTVDQWIRTTGGTQAWNTSGFWLKSNLSGGLLPVPNQAGDIANVVADLVANQLINLNGNLTIGSINLGDMNGASVYTIGNAGTDSLIFDNSTWGGVYNLGGRAALNKVMGGADVISDVLLSSDLAIYNRVAFTIAGNITDGGGFKSLMKLGTNNLTLSGINSYSGDTIIKTTGGTVFLNATGGDAIASPLIRLGNSSYDGSVSTVMQLLQSNQIDDASVIRFDGGSGRNAFFRLNGFNETLQGISDVTGQGVIENIAGSASTLTLNTGGNDYSYNGFLRNGGSGVLSLVKSGAGQLSLSGANISFTGGLTIMAGSGPVKISNVLASSSAQNVFGSEITNNASLEMEATSNWIFSKVITGSGTFLKSGAANLTVTANNTYTGATSIENGALQLVAGGRISASSPAMSLSKGGTLSLVNSSNTSGTGNTAANSTTVTMTSTAGLVPGMAVSGPNIPGGATIAAIISGTQFALSAPATAAATGQAFNFAIGGANQADRVLNGAPLNLNGGGLRFENNGEGATYTETLGAVTLAGGRNIITAGRAGGTSDAAQSTLTLSSLTRQAQSTVNFQVPDVNIGAALGADLTNQVVVSSGLSLDDGIVGGWATVGNEWATYGANGVTALGASGYSKIIGGNTNTYAGSVSSITVTDATGIVVGMGVTGSNNIQPGTTVTSVSGTTIGLSLPTTGAGGNNPVFGTFANNQNLKLSTVTGAGTNTTINYWMPSGSIVNSVNIQDVGGRVFNLNGREIVIGSGGILSSGADHTLGTANASAGVIKVLTSSGHAAGFNELVVTVGDSSTRNLTINAQVADNGAIPATLVKSGVGKLTLNPFVTTNSYTGGTTVLGGSIEIRHEGNLGSNSTANYLVMNGGAVEFATGVTVNIGAAGSRAITIEKNGGRFEMDQGETLNIASAVPITGPGLLTIGAGDATGGTLNMDGVLGMQGGLSMVAGTLVLKNPANSFIGGITMTGGTLQVSAAGSLPAENLTMNGGILRIMDGGPGGTVTIGALSGNSTAALIQARTTLANPPANLPTLLIVDQDINTTFAGKIEDRYSPAGEKSRLSFAKLGSGILTLSNEESSFRGTVTIQEGALAVTKLGYFAAQNSSIGFGAIPALEPTANSAEWLSLASGTSLIFVGSIPSITDRSFTMGTGPEGAAIYANGTTVGATLEFLEYPGEQVQFDAADLGATLTLGGRNTGNNIFGLKLSDNGAGATSLVKTGPGTWILNNLNGSNDFTGSTTIYEGRLVITGDGALGTKGGSGPPVQLVGGVLDLRGVDYTASGADTEDLLLAGGRLDTSSGTSSWAGRIDIVANSVPNVNVARDATLTLGTIGGGGALDKDNFGTLVLNGANTYTGTTRVRDGRLVLDYSTSAADNKLSNTSGLFLGGGRTGAVLELKNTSGTSVVEVVPGTTLDRGEHNIVKDPGTVLGRAVIDLGAITRNTGALLDVESGGLARTVTNNNATGILGAWATVGHTSWAFKNETNNVTGFIEPVSSFVIDNWVSTSSNTDVQNSNAQSNATSNTLRFNQASTPVIVTLDGTNTLQSAGILVTPNVNVVDQIQGGVLTVGPATTSAGELVIQQFSQTAGFIIGSTIANRTVAPAIANVGLQKLGPGVLALTGANTYTGITTIAGGTLMAGTLTDGGVASSVGQATFAAANIVIGGGTLEYTGESTAINRSLTVKEFGALNVGDEDMTLTLAGDEVLGGAGSVVGDSGTAFWDKTGAGTLRLLRKETSGGASGIQTLNVADGKLILEYGYSTTPATPSVPAPPNATDRLFNTNANLTVSGGKLEFIGEDYVFGGNGSFQRFFSQFTVGTGASEIQVTSRTGLDPLITQPTTLGIGDTNNAQEILREVGGTVLFVENPNGGRVTLNLFTVGQDQGKVLPWATYWNKNDLAQPGVNNFAAIEQTDETVVSADSKSLYSTKSNPFDWTNNGLEHITEETGTPFGGSTLDPDFRIATLRFFNDTGNGTVTLSSPGASESLTLTNGAILVAANVKNNVKTLTGGELTSTYLPTDGQAELIIHNYNPNQAFRLESKIVDPSSLPTSPALNLVHTGTGTTALFAANTYSGATLVTGGVLRLENASAIPGGISSSGGTSVLTLDGGQIGLTSASGDFTRGLGSGVDQVRWTSSGGFAAYGVDRAVNLGGNVSPVQVRWGVGGFVPSGDTLVLGAADADKTLTFANPIDLGVTDRLVRVENGGAAEDAVISGALTGGGSLTKSGEGGLRLTAASTHLGGVTLAEGTLFVPAPAVLGSGTLGVGISGNTSANDAPVLVLESGTIPNVLNVGNKNTAGITTIEVPDNVTLNGAVTLDKSKVFIGPDSGKTLTVNGAVGGSGGLDLVDGGKIVLNSANTYGSGGGAAGTAIDGSTIVRNGTLEVRSATALGDGTKAVELGDAMTTPVVVDRATTGTSLLLTQGSFDPTGNGVPGSLNGIGAFYNVSRTLDGAVYTSGDVSKLILVKDEVDNPERNGVYEIVSVNATAGTMNLKRVDNGSFPLQPLHIAYGTDITVQNGTVNAGRTLFLAARVDAADINSDPFYWKTETSLNPNVSLLVGSGLSSPVTNPIDVNDTNGTGATTIGFVSGAVRGTTTLSGNVTLQSQIAGAEDKDLFLNAEVCTDLVFGGSITDPGAGDTLNLIKTGTGTVTLAGANDFNGITRVQAGVLKLDNASALGASNAGSGNLNIAGGIVGLTTASGDLTARALGTGAGQIQWTDSGGFAAFGTDRAVNVGANVTWGSTPGFVATGKELVFGTEHATNKAALSTSIALGTTRRTVQVDNGPAAVEGELSGVLSAAGGSGGSILKTGHGTLLLSNNGNTFGDSVVVKQGVLQGSASNSFGGVVVEVGSASTTAGDLAAVEFIADPVGTATLTTLSPITVGNNPGVKRIDATNGPNVAAANADVHVSNQVTLQLNQPGNNHVFVGPDVDARLQFNNTVSGAGGITIVDGGTLILAGSNTYGTSGGAQGAAVDGGTILRSGTIELRNDNALGATTVELGDLTTGYAAVDRASNGISLGECGAIFSSGTWSNVDAIFDGVTYTGLDAGKRLLIKDELANPERNGIYTIQSVSGGAMTLVRVSDFDQSAEMGYGSQVPVTGGSSAGRSYFLAGGVSAVNTSPLSWQPTVANPNVALVAGTGGLAIANNIDLNATGSTGTTTIGAVSTLTSGTVTFSGNVTMQSLNAGTENLIVDITSSSITGTATGVTFSGIVADGPDSLQLRKIGAGVATLAGANTYDGGTQVNAGVLLVNNPTGSGTGTGAVAVSGVGTVLGGTGTIGGNTTVNTGAILMPGAGVNDANATFDSSVESLAFGGALTLGTGSKVVFQLNGATPVTGYDQVLVTGGLTVDATAIIQVVLGYTPALNASFNLFDWGGLSSDGNLVDQLQLPALSAGSWDTSQFDSLGVLSVVVPEPGRMLLMLTGGLAAFFRRKRAR